MLPGRRCPARGGRATSTSEGPESTCIGPNQPLDYSVLVGRSLGRALNFLGRGDRRHRARWSPHSPRYSCSRSSIELRGEKGKSCVACRFYLVLVVQPPMAVEAAGGDPREDWGVLHQTGERRARAEVHGDIGPRVVFAAAINAATIP